MIPTLTELFVAWASRCVAETAVPAAPVTSAVTSATRSHFRHSCFISLVLRFPEGSPSRANMTPDSGQSSFTRNCSVSSSRPRRRRLLAELAAEDLPARSLRQLLKDDDLAWGLVCREVLARVCDE